MGWFCCQFCQDKFKHRADYDHHLDRGCRFRTLPRFEQLRILRERRRRAALDDEVL